MVAPRVRSTASVLFVVALLSAVGSWSILFRQTFSLAPFRHSVVRTSSINRLPLGRVSLPSHLPRRFPEINDHLSVRWGLALCTLAGCASVLRVLSGRSATYSASRMRRSISLVRCRVSQHRSMQLASLEHSPSKVPSELVHDHITTSFDKQFVADMQQVVFQSLVSDVEPPEPEARDAPSASTRFSSRIWRSARRVGSGRRPSSRRRHRRSRISMAYAAREHAYHRHVGAKLQSKPHHESMSLSYDPSRVPVKLQVSLRAPKRHHSGHGRKARTASSVKTSEMAADVVQKRIFCVLEEEFMYHWPFLLSSQHVIEI